MKRYEMALGAILVGLLIYVAPARTRQATAQTPPNCRPGQDLITVPEIRSDDGRLRAEISITSGKRTLWGSAGDTRCVPQDLRYFKGRDLLKRARGSRLLVGRAHSRSDAPRQGRRSDPGEVSQQR